MPGVAYLDTSAVLRIVLEDGSHDSLLETIDGAAVLMTSRLSLVESARAFHRLRRDGDLTEVDLSDAEAAIASLWSRCAVWELDQTVCDLAASVAAGTALRTLDALHLATFSLARKELGSVQLVTCDARLKQAAGL